MLVSFLISCQMTSQLQGEQPSQAAIPDGDAGKKMRRTPVRRLIALGATVALFSPPSSAGLGPAVSDAPTIVNAWCGKPLNNCRITFEGDRMRVDGNEGIAASQILMINTIRTHKPAWWPPSARNRDGHRWDFQVTYEEGGKKVVATFMFVNEQGVAELESAIQRFAPNLRPIGPSIRIEKD